MDVNVITSDENLRRKLAALQTVLHQIGSAVLAFSGGVDSTLLLRVASGTLDNNILAVTAVSDIYPGFEGDEARQLAEKMGVKHMFIHTQEIEMPEFSQNPPERCYYCKKELFSRLQRIARQQGIRTVIDGTNADDGKGIDHRPGLRAGQELGVRSPLREVGMTKHDIRELSRALRLPTWDKPSLACLSSRFPYGTAITTERLQQVGEAETFLRELGFRQVRVRYHSNLARIEVEPPERVKLLEDATRVVERLRSLGFTYVAMDMEGYRTGSTNEVLDNTPGAG